MKPIKAIIKLRLLPNRCTASKRDTENLLLIKCLEIWFGFSKRRDVQFVGG